MFSENALRELPPDERDLHLGALVDYPKLEDLPKQFSIGNPISIKDQTKNGDDDMCTAYAYCGTSEFQELTELWPPFSFAASKRISGDIEAWGQDLRSAAKAHQQFGAVEPKDTTEGDKQLTPKQRRYFNEYSLQAVSNAKKHYKQSYVRV